MSHVSSSSVRPYAAVILVVSSVVTQSLQIGLETLTFPKVTAAQQDDSNADLSYASNSRISEALAFETSERPRLALVQEVQPRGTLTRTCSVLEGPHIELFQKPGVSMLAVMTSRAKQSQRRLRVHSNKSRSDNAYQEGWLVKSGHVSIQGHFVQYDESPELTRFALRAIAIGGDFLEGNSLVIGSFADQITWNGRPILEEKTSSFEIHDEMFLLSARRGLHSSLVGDLTRENPGVNIDLPLGVSLIVNRMLNHINVAIKMPPQVGGEDGLCGQISPSVVGETLQLLDLNVAPGDSLFADVPFN